MQRDTRNSRPSDGFVDHNRLSCALSCDDGCCHLIAFVEAARTWRALSVAQEASGLATMAGLPRTFGAAGTLGKRPLPHHFECRRA